MNESARNPINLRVNEDGSDDMEGKYLSFWVDQQMYGIPIAQVVQIVAVQQITQLPQTQPYEKGVIHLRGSIIPIIDMRLRLGKPPRAYDERTCIIVSKIDQYLVGFVVDAVEEVTSIDPKQISRPPNMRVDESAAYLTGIATQGSRVILLISTQKLLGTQELLALSQSIMEVTTV